MSGLTGNNQSTAWATMSASTSLTLQNYQVMPRQIVNGALAFTVSGSPEVGSQTYPPERRRIHLDRSIHRVATIAPGWLN